MNRLMRFCAPAIAIGLFASAAAADISEQARNSIDRVIGHKGTYIPQEGVYKIVLPREEAIIVQSFQTLSPNLGLNSWASFTAGVHHEAILTGQLLLLDDEVNPVMDAVLNAGLDITGLSTSCSFQGPHLHTVDVTGVGAFPTIASAFRNGLDKIQQIRQTAAVSRTPSAPPAIPIESAINPGPLDAVLAMKGTVTAGVYKAAIGTRTLLNGEFVGREMGMSTWISVAVGYGSGALAVLNEDGTKVSETALDAHPESFQLEKNGPRLFVNLPKSRNVAVVNRTTAAVVATWSTDSAFSNYPMTLDEEDHRLFVVCRVPARLLVFDTSSGKIVAKLPVVGDSDDVFYDKARQRIYATGGEGRISVFQQDDPDHYRQIADIATVKGARTSFFSSDLQQLFVAVRRQGSEPAAVRVYSVQ